MILDLRFCLWKTWTWQLAKLRIVYLHLIEFYSVEYKQFYRNLSSHHAQVKKQLKNYVWMAMALAHDQQLHQWKMKKCMWQIWKAKAFFKEYIKAGKYKLRNPHCSKIQGASTHCFGWKSFDSTSIKKFVPRSWTFGLKSNKQSNRIFNTNVSCKL